MTGRPTYTATVRAEIIDGCVYLTTHLGEPLGQPNDGRGVGKCPICDQRWCALRAKGGDATTLPPPVATT